MTTTAEKIELILYETCLETLELCPMELFKEWVMSVRNNQLPITGRFQGLTMDKFQKIAALAMRDFERSKREISITE